MGHKEINIHRVIPAPPGAVFALLLDRSTWPAWSGHDAFEPVRPGTAGPYDVGSVGLLRSGCRVVREEIVEVVADQRVGYTLLAGLPLRGYRAGFKLTPTANDTEVGWHASFDAPPGFGWLYVAALRRFTGRLLDGLSKRLRDAPPPGVDPLPAFALVWTTTAAGLALFARRSPPLATALAAAAAGLVFDLPGRVPGPWGIRVAAAAGPGSTARPHQPADPVRLNPTATLGCHTGHHDRG